MNFENSVAVVTGGLSGIGLAIVCEFLKNGIKNISILDVIEEVGNKTLLELGSKFKEANIIFNKTDVSDEKEVEDAFLKTIEKFKKIDILVNNAGIGGDNMKIVDVNLKGTILCSKVANKYMGKYHGGNGGINICISSIGCYENYVISPIYNATKSAIRSYVLSYGQEYHFKKTGIKYICLCPGATTTSISKIFEKHMSDSYWKDFKGISVVFQSPEKVGKAAVYLLNNGTNGSVWLINEGNLFIEDIPDYKKIFKSVINDI